MDQGERRGSDREEEGESDMRRRREEMPTRREGEMMQTRMMPTTRRQCNKP